MLFRSFANACVPIAQLLQVVDYHILMLHLTGLTATSTSSLVYTNVSNPYSSTAFTYSNYSNTDNIKNAKYFYAISTLAQAGNVIFGDAVSSDVIVGGVFADPVYAIIGSSSTDDDKIYSLVAALATVCSSNSTIRSS